MGNANPHIWDCLYYGTHYFVCVLCVRMLAEGTPIGKERRFISFGGGGVGMLSPYKGAVTQKGRDIKHNTGRRQKVFRKTQHPHLQLNSDSNLRLRLR